MIRSLLLALTFALLVAAPAGAQAPTDLGAGQDPSLIVDAGGTAHVVFSPRRRLLPHAARRRGLRRADGAPARRAGTAARGSSDRPDGALGLIRSTCESDDTLGTLGRTYLRGSADRGVTWSPPAVSATAATGSGRPSSRATAIPADAGARQARRDLRPGPVHRGADAAAQPSRRPGRRPSLARHDRAPGRPRSCSADGDYSVARWRPVRRRRHLRHERGHTRHRSQRRERRAPRAGRAERSCSSTSRSPTSACGRSRPRSHSAPSTPGGHASAPAVAPAPTAASSAPRAAAGRPRTAARDRRHAERRRLDGASSPRAPAPRSRPGPAGRPCCSARGDARERRRVRLGAAPDGRGFALWQERRTCGRCCAAPGPRAPTGRAPTRTTGRPAPATLRLSRPLAEVA